MMIHTRPVTLIRAAALSAGLALTAFATLVSANGVPVSLVLSYLSGVSNWGPTNATGVAEIVPREGEARVTVTGLPKLTDEEYVVWIVNTARGESVALGSFAVGESGVGKLDVVREPFPDQEWDTLMISVEAAGAKPGRPGARHSVAGKKPIPGTQDGRPNELPNTGGASNALLTVSPAIGASGPTVTWPVLISVLLIGMLLSGAAGFRIARLTQRRSEG